MRLVFLVVLAFSNVEAKAETQTIKTDLSKHLGGDWRTYQGREIPLVIYQSHPKSEKSPKKFFLQGGLHGNETTTTEFINYFIAELEKRGPLFPSTPIEIYFLPKANPDSFATDRYNQNHVNLNRNFDILWGLSTEPTGVVPFSEPETKAIQALFKKHSFTSSIDIHGYVNWMVAPTAPKELNSRVSHGQITRYYRWTSSIRKAMEKFLPSYSFKTAGGLGDGGSFEDWAFWSQNSFAVCLEMQSKSRFIVINDKTIDTFFSYQNIVLHLFREALKIETTPLEEVTFRDYGAQEISG